MKNATFDYDLETGFCWITTDEDLAIQACLCFVENDEGDIKYIKKLDGLDSGMQDGICRDVNQAAVDKYGFEDCVDAVFAAAGRAGFEIV